MDQERTAFQPLGLTTLGAEIGFARPSFQTPNPVKVTAPALEVMTDLHQVPAATVSGRVDIETTSQKMIARSVRLLLVVDDDDHVIGLITARDISGDRPMEIMANLGIPFDQVKVSHVMTPADHIEVMTMDDVMSAKVGDIIMTLKHSWRQHAVVVETDQNTGRQVIRGIFSASQIARQLGIAPQFHELSQAFAEIDRAINIKS